MPATIPNIAKGRENEFVHRVLNGDPATAGFVVVLLQDTDIEDLATLRDYDTLEDILAGDNVECSVSSYSRLVLDGDDISAPTVNDSNDAQTFDIPDQDFGALEAGQSIQGVVMCYAPNTAGADSTMIPVYIDRFDTAVPLNGEIFHWRTPNGLWSAEEPA